MEGVCEEESEQLSRFIELFLSLLQHGFDEMEMQKRLELVRLFGSTMEHWVEKTYGRMLCLEHRVEQLEKLVQKP
ncbi:MAG: hypothetical protein WC525_02335 [Candidatus Thermoplasmatota archaeon]